VELQGEVANLKAMIDLQPIQKKARGYDTVIREEFEAMRE
jgi:hypothetical protein